MPRTFPGWAWTPSWPRRARWWATRRSTCRSTSTVWIPPAPGTGTPEVGGVTVREAQAMLRGLAGLNIAGGDLVEVAPAYDATANTAHAGAQIMFEILSLMCVARGR